MIVNCLGYTTTITIITTDLLMIVDCLGPVVAERVWVVGQWRPQKCDCICGGKENLEEDRKEKEAKHLAASVLVLSTNLHFFFATLWFPTVANSLNV